MLEFSEQAHSPMRKVKVQDLVSFVMNVVRHPISINIKELTIKHDQDIHSIRCRSSQIQQVLVNILQNALNSLCHKNEAK
jgi:C4-dicarboxylate-specific signal transduction histidine kinase